LLLATKLKTDIPFLGREAVEKAKADGPRRRLVGFMLQDPAVMMWGGELVLHAGVAIGQVTSAAWGATVGSAVGLAYVRHPNGDVVDADFLTDGRFEINVNGQLKSATIYLKPAYDPASEKVKQ